MKYFLRINKSGDIITVISASSIATLRIKEGDEETYIPITKEEWERVNSQAYDYTVVNGKIKEKKLEEKRKEKGPQNSFFIEIEKMREKIKNIEIRIDALERSGKK